MLEIRNLKFAYGDHKVLKDISFEAREGEMLCILGPNGAGKSTMFRCILGLLRGYEGEILIDGSEVSDLPARERASRMAYIPQTSKQAFSYTALDMVLMGASSALSAWRAPGARERKQALAALERLGILELSGRLYTNLSGGEQQLVLIARAIAQGAKTLIMDEPTSSLDYGNQMRVEQQLKSLADEGYLIVQSTHNPEQTYMFADRIIAIKDGTIISAGRPEEIMDEELIRELYGIEVSVVESAQGKARFFEIKER